VAEARAANTAAQVAAVYTAKAANDGKGMWRALATIAGDKPTAAGPVALRDPRGGRGLLTAPADIANTLAAHYERMSTAALHTSNTESFDEEHKRRIEQDVTGYRAHASYQDDAGHPELSAAITVEEVARQCAALHNGKAPSPLDAVPNELLKYGGAPVHAALAALFDMQFALEAKAKTPGVICPIYKKGDQTEPGNYRPITLGSSIDKLYNSVLNARLMACLEETGGLHEAQQGFRPGRSAVDNVFMLRACLDARLQAKLNTYILFLDIEKAYDRVWRGGLLWQLWRKGVRGRMFRVLANMIDRTPCMVLHDGAMSDAVLPDLGWEQGDTLATTMFNVFVDGVLDMVCASCPGVPMDGQAGPWPRLVALMYADDLASLADSQPALQALADAVRAALRLWRLNASVSESDGSKTAVMCVGRTPGAAMEPVRWGTLVLPRARAYK
jgi:hypothetical protein